MNKNLSLHIMNIVDTTSYKLHSRLPTGNVSYILPVYLHGCFFFFPKAPLQQPPEKLAQLLQVRESLMEEEEQ